MRAVKSYVKMGGVLCMREGTRSRVCEGGGEW